MELACELGCSQVRSASDYRYAANHRLKLRLGFGAHPGVREVGGEPRPAIFFVKTVT